MGEKVKPQYKSDFDLPTEGIHILKVDDVKIEPSKDSVKNFKVVAIVEGGDDDGRMAFDNFPLVSKKLFGLSRLSGFLIKLGVLKEAEEFDSDVFGTEKFENKFKVDVPGKIYGGRIKHKKTDQGNVMANIAEYYTTKEAMELMKSGPTTGEKSKGKGKAKEEKEPETKEDEEWV